jgi:hypothetical protein
MTKLMVALVALAMVAGVVEKAEAKGKARTATFREVERIKESMKGLTSKEVERARERLVTTYRPKAPDISRTDGLFLAVESLGKVKGVKKSVVDAKLKAGSETMKVLEIIRENPSKSVVVRDFIEIMKVIIERNPSGTNLMLDAMFSFFKFTAAESVRDMTQAYVYEMKGLKENATRTEIEAVKDTIESSTARASQIDSTKVASVIEELVKTNNPQLSETYRAWYDQAATNMTKEAQMFVLREGNSVMSDSMSMIRTTTTFSIRFSLLEASIEAKLEPAVKAYEKQGMEREQAEQRAREDYNKKVAVKGSPAEAAHLKLRSETLKEARDLVKRLEEARCFG